MAEVKPLPSNPTNADLADSILQLHECLEVSITDTRKGLLKAAKERNQIRTEHLKLVSKVDNVTVIVDDIKTNQGKVKDALGIEKSKKPIGLISQTRLAATIFGAASVAGGAWRFTEFMWPTFMVFLHQLHLYIMK